MVGMIKNYIHAAGVVNMVDIVIQWLVIYTVVGCGRDRLADTRLKQGECRSWVVFPGAGKVVVDHRLTVRHFTCVKQAY